MYQAIFNGHITNPRTSFTQRLKGRFSRSLRNFLKNRTSPNTFIEYKVKGLTMTLPFSHALPDWQFLHPFYADNLVRLTQFVQRSFPDITVIDIGANVGDTAVLIQAATPVPILCIEGSDEYMTVLKKNIAPLKDVELEVAFVSNASLEKDIEIVSSKIGTSYIREASADSGVKSTKVTTLTISQILDKHPRFKNTQLLKIDTDGYDCMIMRSEMEWLSKQKPTIFFEYAPGYFPGGKDAEFPIFKELNSIGYEYFLFYDGWGQLICTVDPQSAHLFEEMHSLTKRTFWFDVTAFHRDQKAMFDNFRSEELNFYATKYKKN